MVFAVEVVEYNKRIFPNFFLNLIQKFIIDFRGREGERRGKKERKRD